MRYQFTLERTSLAQKTDTSFKQHRFWAFSSNPAFMPFEIPRRGMRKPFTKAVGPRRNEEADCDGNREMVIFGM
jgi:hypothetical protein